MYAPGTTTGASGTARATAVRPNSAAATLSRTILSNVLFSSAPVIGVILGELTQEKDGCNGSLLFARQKEIGGATCWFIWMSPHPSLALLLRFPRPLLVFSGRVQTGSQGCASRHGFTQRFSHLTWLSD